MNRFFTIIQVHNKHETIKYVASILGAYPEDLLEDMGYSDWYDFNDQRPSSIVVARKLNDILKEADLNLRIGGSSVGIRAKRSIFR